MISTSRFLGLAFIVLLLTHSFFCAADQIHICQQDLEREGILQRLSSRSKALVAAIDDGLTNLLKSGEPDATFATLKSELDDIEAQMAAYMNQLNAATWEPAPLYAMKRLRPDLLISRAQLERAKQARLGSNIPFEILASDSRVRSMNPAEAGRAGRRIIETIRRSGALVRQDDHDAALALLSDPNFLEGSEFFLRTEREVFPASALANRSPDTFLSRHMIGSASVNVETGEVNLPHPPPRVADPQLMRRAQLSWILAAAEEYGHVAQILMSHESPEGQNISRMMSAWDSPIRSRVHLEIDDLGERFKASLGYNPAIFRIREVDIYAFLIESFGPDFVPAWRGHDSGYEVRRHVDDLLSERGVPNRAWPTGAERLGNGS